MATYVKNKTADRVASESSHELFRYNYLPKPLQRMLKEAFGCYAADLYLAFAVLCRRIVSVAESDQEPASVPRFKSLYDDAATLSQIDAASRQTLDDALFGSAIEPALDADQAAILIEIFKDMLEQRYVRTAKLRRAIEMRRFFAHEAQHKDESDSIESTLRSVPDR